MRYFLFTTTSTSHRAGTVISHTIIQNEVFPSNIELKAVISLRNPDVMEDTIVITNIFEFKTEQDFIDFNAQ